MEKGDRGFRGFRGFISLGRVIRGLSKRRKVI